MKTDMQRAKAIDEFISEIPFKELQTYANKNFKVRIGADYGVGNGEVATFTHVNEPYPFYWTVTFNRSKKVFKVYLDEGHASIIRDATISWFERD